MSNDVVTTNRHYLKAFLAETKANEVTGDTTYRFRASSSTLDRQGEVVEQNWDTRAFEANPVFLLAHDYRSLPIGKVIKVTTDPQGLIVDVVFDQLDETARMVEGKFARGFLNAVSVGFTPIETSSPKKPGEPLRFLKSELLEVSAVAIPANPDALMMRMLEVGSRELMKQLQTPENRQAHPPHTTPMADMDMMWDAGAEVGKAEGAEQLWRMHAWRDSEADPAAKASYKLPHHTAEGQVVWRGVAAAMAALMGARGGVQIPDSDRRGVHAHLARHYAQFDKEPPEFKTLDELSAFGPEEVRGLFWEGELDELPVQKVGRKLSKATLERMRRVMGLMEQATDGMREMMDEMETMGGTEDGEEGGDKGLQGPPEPEPEPEIDIDVDLEALYLKARAVQAATQGV